MRRFTVAGGEVIAVDAYPLFDKNYWRLPEDQRPGPALTIAAQSAQEALKLVAEDPRYAYQVCSKCGDAWQLIDYGCSLHILRCGHPVPEPRKGI